MDQKLKRKTKHKNMFTKSTFEEQSTTQFTRAQRKTIITGENVTDVDIINVNFKISGT